MHYPEQSFAQSLTENEEKVERKKKEEEREREARIDTRTKTDEESRIERRGWREKIDKKKTRKEPMLVYNSRVHTHIRTHLYIYMFKRVAT